MLIAKQVLLGCGVDNSKSRDMFDLCSVVYKIQFKCVLCQLTV